MSEKPLNSTKPAIEESALVALAFDTPAYEDGLTFTYKISS